MQFLRPAAGGLTPAAGRRTFRVTISGKTITVRFEMMRATLYAWEICQPRAARQST